MSIQSGYGRIYVSPDVKATCQLYTDYDQKLQLAEFDAQRAAIEFAKAYKAAIDEEVSTGKKLFGEKEQRSLLSMLAPYFLPEVPGSVTMAELTDPSAFAGKYGGDDFAALSKAMKENAQRQWASDSCADLAAMQLAALPTTASQQ